MDRCHICRVVIEEQEVRRRVLPVAQTRGVTVSASPGFSSYVHEAPVSLCPTCDAAVTHPSRTRWQLVKGIILCWLGVGIVGNLLAVGLRSIMAGQVLVPALVVGGLCGWFGARYWQRPSQDLTRGK